MSALRCLALAVVLTACATHRPPPKQLAANDYPGTLVSPASQPGDFLLRQQLVASFPGGTQSFEAVLQKKGDKLTLIALTPFGTKAFVLEQSGTDVTFTPYLSRELPFPPRFILNDVQRTYFKGLPHAPLSDGWHHEEREGERISERWANGRLMERHFLRLEQDPPGEIAVTYVDGMADGRSPPRIEFENGWFGYHLSISTVSETTL